MAQDPLDYSSWLKEPMLRLKEIINIARGASIEDWSLRDEPDENGVNWLSRFRTLKAYCKRDMLPYTPKPGAENIFTEATVFLDETWEFLQLEVPDEPSVEWLREFCRHKWAKTRAENLPDFAPSAKREKLTSQQKNQRAKKAGLAFQDRVKNWPGPPYPRESEDYAFMTIKAGWLPRRYQRDIRRDVCASCGKHDWLKPGPRNSALNAESTSAK